MPTIIVIDGTTLTLKKYPEFDPGIPVSTDIFLFGDPVTGLLKKTTLANIDTNFATNNLTATGDRTHTFGDKTCSITFNSLAGAAGLTLSSTSTAATLSAQRVLFISLSGANANPSQITYGAHIINSHSGTNVVNNGLVAQVSNGTAGSKAVSAIIDTGIGVDGASTNGYGGSFSSANADGLLGQAVSGIGVTGSSSSGVASYGTTTSGLAGRLIATPASTNTIVTLLELIRQSSGTAANGIGGAVDFYVKAADGAGHLTNQFISKWTDATGATRTSQLIITGVNNAVTADLLTLSGNGALQLNKYGVGTFTGTPAKTLQVDASGNIIEGSVSISAITADNGLTANTSTNIQLGGTLLQNSTIDATASYNLNITGANTSSSLGVLKVTNTTATFGRAIYAEITNGAASAVAVYAKSAAGGTAVSANETTGTGMFSTVTSGTAVRGTSTSGFSGVMETTSGTALQIQAIPSSTNTVVTLLNAIRGTSGSAAAGIGGSIDFQTGTSISVQTSNQLISKWTDSTSATRTSQFVIKGTLSAAAVDLITLNADGSWQIRPITATAASAITPAEGMILFVSNTDATFTTIGIWCYQNGAWKAL